VPPFEHRIDEHLELTPVERRDAGPLFALIEACRDDLRTWLPWVDHTRGPDDVLRFIERAMESHAADRELHCCIRFEGAIAGVVSYRRIDRANRKTELGYWLGEQYQGRGIMTRCCRALTEHAFSSLDLNRVEIRCGERNVKSAAVARRLGFVYEGTLRDAEWVNDRFVSHMVFSMLRADWTG